MEKLKEVRAIADRGCYTELEITTDKSKHVAKLPFTTVWVKNHTERRYSLSIFDYCKLHNIVTYYYINFPSNSY